MEIFSVIKELLLEEGKVAEWEAPCHQYALVEEEVEEEVLEEELDGVSGSDKNSFQTESEDTDGERKRKWKVEELEKDQAAFLSKLILPISPMQMECVLSSWKYREKAGDDSIVKGMLEDMVKKQRFDQITGSGGILILMN